MLTAALVLSHVATARQSAPSDNPFEPEIRRYEAEDAKHPVAPGGIVFVGSSSIVRWKTLAQDFPHHHVINRGFGGSAVSDSVLFADRIVTPYQPKMVVFFAGSNDIASGKSAETVLKEFKTRLGRIGITYQTPAAP